MTTITIEKVNYTVAKENMEKELKEFSYFSQISENSDYKIAIRFSEYKKEVVIAKYDKEDMYHENGKIKTIAKHIVPVEDSQEAITLALEIMAEYGAEPIIIGWE